MKIFIEGLIILSLFFIFFFWFIWFKWSERRLLKKYKPENDKGRSGNEFRGTATAETRTRGTGYDFDGLEQSKRRELLQTTETNNDGKTNDGNGENNKSNRRFKFIRRK